MMNDNYDLVIRWRSLSLRVPVTLASDWLWLARWTGAAFVVVCVVLSL